MLKYENIANDIRSSIEDGSLKPGEKLPTVVELCEVYAVSKITVQKAIDRLTEMGLVTSRRGSGTYVKETPLLSDHPLAVGISDRAQGFCAEHAGADETVSSVVHTFEVVSPSAKVAGLLHLTAEDFVYFYCRTRNVNGVPIVIEETYMPLDVVPGLKQRHLLGSVYSFIQDKLGLRISSFHRTIRATKAHARDAERLQIAEGDPLLEFEQVGYLDSGVPFEYAIDKNVGSRYSLNTVTMA